jgi:hypothetical protein
MTGADARRQRIVRIRAVEHRIAQQMLAQAQREVDQIRSIRDRITALTCANTVEAGESCGIALAAIAETQSRLARARQSTAAPLHQALVEVSRRQAIRAHAEIREQSARRILEKSEAERNANEERRASASRCYRTNVDAGDKQ